MRIDPRTMLFHDMTPEERSDLLDRVTKIVLNGVGYPTIDPFFLAWCEAVGYNTAENRLLMFSTAYPQRALLSLVYGG